MLKQLENLCTDIYFNLKGVRKQPLMFKLTLEFHRGIKRGGLRKVL